MGKARRKIRKALGQGKDGQALYEQVNQTPGHPFEIAPFRLISVLEQALATRCGRNARVRQDAPFPGRACERCA